ncbi:MAG TPA: type III pantothenate kinase [Dongiaceae bacterium]|nr:type III pantothenate kinase [Dongiaceae bacterium]
MADRSRKSRRASPRTRSRTPLLAVDVGNTDTVVGRFRGGELEGFWRLTTGRSTSDELRIALELLVRESMVGWGSIVCSVVPILTEHWRDALRAVTGRAPVELKASNAGIPVEVDEPRAVGPDRLANSFAALRIYGAPAIVVDVGTATTLDCVSKSGAYVGGAIAPGLVTASEELFRRAARLHRVDLRRPRRALGKTTDECLRVGVLWGNAGLVDALVRRVRAELGGRPKVIATGGLAPLVIDEVPFIDAHEPWLTLIGLRLVWERNHGAGARADSFRGDAAHAETDVTAGSDPR